MSNGGRLNKKTLNKSIYFVFLLFVFMEWGLDMDRGGLPNQQLGQSNICVKQALLTWCYHFIPFYILCKGEKVHHSSAFLICVPLSYLSASSLCLPGGAAGGGYSQVIPMEEVKQKLSVLHSRTIAGFKELKHTDSLCTLTQKKHTHPPSCAL